MTPRNWFLMTLLIGSLGFSAAGTSWAADTAESRMSQLGGSEKQPGGVEHRPTAPESAKPAGVAPAMSPPPPAPAPADTAVPPPPPPPKVEEKEELKTRSWRWNPFDSGTTPLGDSSGGSERRPGGVERSPTRE